VFLGCVAALTAVAGCPCKKYERGEAPTLEQVLAALDERRAASESFKTTDTVMDYWLGDDRIKGDVYVMGARGALVRMQALRPDGAVAADLACNGLDFVFIDRLNNCQLTGPCNADSIATLLRVPLAPDDFLYLALGTTPVIEGATGKLEWDSKHGHEVAKLSGAGDMTQTIVLDGRDQKHTWDLLKSEVKHGDEVVWTVEHKDYRTVKDDHGVDRRVPGKSRIRTPTEKSDILIEWGGEREINVELPPASFELAMEEGVPACGQKKP